ncbi:putative membrane protein [Halobacteriovorax marinus SJ]|uniref:Membrane protein n=1 Tax=Halobacteriovorax marinus (strain ATCC BAA-682 / DSM 15412 / SJ) TaxID=862908 RepID=E1X4M0_HALMS|nr:hypothetical protein [Halobacteriovorax marinus]CBW25450.1 putative membrane protein [Halobacteriovorax marinus SJ]
MDFSRLIEWLIFGGILLYAIYSMIAIKEEKQAYVENAKEFELKNFLFFLPSWWGNTTDQYEVDESSHAIFERTDTRYDWRADFIWFKNDAHLADLELEEVLVKKLEELKLIFDPEETIINTPSCFEEFIPYIEGRVDLLHIEGTATENVSERVYFDCYLIKDNINDAYLFAKSRSSILNGAIEGPYFEEVLRTFEFLHQ